MRFTCARGTPEALLGYEREDWLKPGFWPSRIHPQDREAVLAFTVAAVGDRKDHEMEFRVVNSEGVTRWVHEIIQFGQDEGDLVRGYIADVTQRVATEDSLQGATKVKDQIIKLLAEELSQPVNEISSHAQMLERHLSGRGDDTGSDIALGMRSGIENLSLLMLQLREIVQNSALSSDEMSKALAELRKTEDA